jgi:hypothetical protein
VFSIEEKKALVTNFWSGFNLYCSRQRFLRGKKKNWLLHRTKVNNVHLKFDPGRTSVQVILEIQHKSESKRLEIYERIERYKNLLELGFDDELIWDFAFQRETGKEVCRIYTELKNVDINKQSQWEEMYEFMAQKMYVLESNFLEIRDLIRD